MNSSPPNYVESKPAPGSLRLVQEFINTRDVDYSLDNLTAPESLVAWLREWRLLESSVGADDQDLVSAVGLREALRALLWANNGGELDLQAVEHLNRLANTSPLRVRFDEAGHARPAEPAVTVGDALGNLLGLVVLAQAEDTWKRLKACANPGCKWIFYDASRNRVGSWCRMSACGNRAKSKAHRERQREASRS